MLVPLCGLTPACVPTTWLLGGTGPNRGLPGPPLAAALGPTDKFMSSAPRLRLSKFSENRTTYLAATVKLYCQVFVCGVGVASSANARLTACLEEGANPASGAKW